MSDPSIDLPAGQIRFLDNYEPGLKDGTYEITVSQTVSAGGITVPDQVQQFRVVGPRFSLDPADIHAEFPPNGTTSKFAEVLPHVVLTKRLLPWERDIPNLPDTVPWLALLVFQDGELLGDSTNSQTVIANYAQTMTVQTLLGNGSPTVRVPQGLTVAPDELAMSCQVITITNTTFAQIVPTGRELPYLAHGRQVDTSGKVLLNLKDDGLFSVVVSNRFPLPGDATHGAKSVVHLVSLEGFGKLLTGTVPIQPSEAQVQLVSLLSWSFSCLVDPAQKFSGLARNLAYDSTGTAWPAASLLLRLPFTSSSSSDPATVAAQQRLADGYVAAGYHAQTGEDGFAWFRGPCTPAIPNPVPKTGAFETASAAMIFDPTSGVFDHSLSAAWQCGRALALADQTYATTLMRVRQTANALLNQIAHQGSTSPLPPQQVTHSQLAAVFGAGAVSAIQTISTASALPDRTPQVAAGAAPPPVETLRALVAQTDVQSALAQQISTDPDAQAVANWLGQRQLLYSVPFVHLVPDARMLPAETIRFFYLDPNWIGAMTDGAMNIGLGSSRESAVQAALTSQLEQMAAAAALAYRANALNQTPPAAATGPTSGLLIRSALVLGWPGLVVSGTASNNPVALLRVDHVAPDVLLCLFNGVPDTVTLAEPHEGLEFGVDDNGAITTRIGNPPAVTNGNDVTIYNPQNPPASMPTLRSAGMRVLNINLNPDPSYPPTLDLSQASDLLTTIVIQLNQQVNPPLTSIGSADFALQMVKGPEEVTFSFTPRPKPERTFSKS